MLCWQPYQYLCPACCLATRLLLVTARGMVELTVDGFNDLAFAISLPDCLARHRPGIIAIYAF